VGLQRSFLSLCLASFGGFILPPFVGQFDLTVFIHGACLLSKTLFCPHASPSLSPLVNFIVENVCMLNEGLPPVLVLLAYRASINPVWIVGIPRFL